MRIFKIFAPGGALEFFVEMKPKKRGWGLALLLSLSALGLALGCGVWDYSFEIKGDYELWRCNSFDIHVTKGHSPLIHNGDFDHPKYGPVSGLNWDERYIYVRHYAASGSQKVDPSHPCLFVIDMREARADGPYNENDFLQHTKKLGVAPVALLDLGEAREKSHREHPEQPDVAHLREQNKFADFVGNIGISVAIFVLWFPTIIVPLWLSFNQRYRKQRLKIWLCWLVLWLLPALYGIYIYNFFNWDSP